MEISAEGIQKAYGPDVVINDASFVLERGQKVGLVGYNGTGKTTLLKIMAGIEEPDGGEIQIRQGVTVGYLPQDTSLTTDETIDDYVRRVSGIAELESKLAHLPEAVVEYERRDGYAFQHRLDIMLDGFGFDAVSSNRQISSLSSGQKSKVFMAGVLLADPDVLLLDEPTNNLDLPALVWLEDFLMRSEAACLVVSHDRLFLDRIVRKIFELDWHTRTITIVNGRYSDYIVRRQKAQVRQAAEHEEQQREIKRLADQAREQKARAVRGSHHVGTDNDKFLRGFRRDRAAGSGRAAKSLERRIEQMEPVERPVERNLFRIHLQPTKTGGSRNMELQDAVIGYADSAFRIGPLTLNLPFGSRTVIMGLNGTGKSTLLKTIGGDVPPVTGEMKIGSALVVGNLMQEHDNLPRDVSMGDFLQRKAGISLQDAYQLATQYGFSATEIDKKLAALSPGGRARLLLALFSALSVNVLLLDEPTNHLDLEALDALEEAVTHYEGTVVLVSHDRSFLEKFRATDVYVLIDGQLVRQRSFAEYLAAAEREAKRLIDML
ncbi:MAG: ABC-F family ATP-binding cassette domain-containing protein [bacterium]|nr:ABC-F family ATP-binding cassette domain-containing protein [bacterium]